jgi:hypothetical protein
VKNKEKEVRGQTPIVCIGTTFEVDGKQVAITRIGKKAVYLSNGDSVLFADIEKAVLPTE